MNITELSIKRPTVSWVMSLILIVFGLFVFWKLPVRELPNGIQPPVVQIQVDYKSAAASIVDQEVTQVVEDVIAEPEGIKIINIAPIIPGRDNGRVIFQNTSNRDNPKSLPASINEKSILSNETYRGSKAKAAHA